MTKIISLLYRVFKLARWAYDLFIRYKNNKKIDEAFDENNSDKLNDVFKR